MMTATPPKISLVVPCYNGAADLTAALQSFLAQDLPPDSYEIIVVDNNSTDGTPELAEQILSTGAVPWTVRREANQGLHHARNHGLRISRGALVVYGDQDIVASRGWLSALANEFARHPRTGVAGGKILPQWEGTPPAWVYDFGDEKIHYLFAYLDRGDERLVLNDHDLFGNNLAFRRELGLAVGGSAPDYFPGNLKHLSGMGESELIDRIRALSWDVVYVPEALIHHAAHADRATPDYFASRYERWGIESVYALLRAEAGGIGRLRRLIAIRKESRRAMRTLVGKGKRDPAIFRRVMRAYHQGRLDQTVRWLRSRSLRRHILRDSHLQEHP